MIQYQILGQMGNSFTTDPDVYNTYEEMLEAAREILRQDKNRKRKYYEKLYYLTWDSDSEYKPMIWIMHEHLLEEKKDEESN